VKFAELPELRNVFARFLDGEPLTELDWIGLVEDYQASIDLFYAMYAIGRNPQKLEVHRNRNAARGDKTEYQLDDLSRQAIEKLNTKDMELYALAKLKFRDLVKRYGDGY
jgi:hypothetical protein